MWAKRAAAGRTAGSKGKEGLRKWKCKVGMGRETVICGLDFAEDSQKELRHVGLTL